MGIAQARKLRANMTDAEQLLWRRLRRRQLDGHKFRRQVPVGLYIADFLCYEKRLIVELDGGQHMERRYHDRQRDDWLRNQGFEVVRFWNDEVLRDPGAVLEEIARQLERRTPPPQPSP
ncbi:endonuclease domain-containing protein [Thioalbus denitrificans]|uniref:Very-short-patch-repair endonuclease n=1 Tax=Thioalbus denitrificans TaxID=547122 RepID=A0A369CIL6_9GAMM|nr:DUF559 domain-containing protein [Thioalbus denitrificans]RCX32277.1 very-short-patch-repair endonuclease [Thioalbus denitrificans]